MCNNLMTIGIWGDSIVYGGVDEGWVGLLRKELARNNVEVYNRGICGDTSEDILKRFPIEAASIEPDIIVVAVGANDTKYLAGSTTNKIPLEVYEQNMLKLVNLAKSRASRIVLSGPIEVNETEREILLKEEPERSMFRNADIMKYSKSLETLAETEKIEFIKMLGVINPITDLGDGVHPNASGYKKMFRTILPFFKN